MILSFYIFIIILSYQSSRGQPLNFSDDVGLVLDDIGGYLLCSLLMDLVNVIGKNSVDMGAFIRFGLSLLLIILLNCKPLPQYVHIVIWNLGRLTLTYPSSL